MMRVIAGRARGRRLKRVPGDKTRPIMDRVKESLFNILSGEIEERRWLDLFAGTGQVGIEALSRGATEVVFVDNTRAAIGVIRDNLRHTRLAEAGVVIQSDAFRFLTTSSAAFDLIYVAPPQYKGMWLAALQAIDARATSLLAADGVVVIQIDPREYEGAPALQHLALYDERRYGNTGLYFYERLPEGGEETDDALPCP